MKKAFAILASIIFMTTNTVLAATSGSPVFYGTDNADSIFYNMSFKDIGGSFAKNDIIRMAALSVIRGGGNQLFYPKDYVKREEVLAYIVRLMGLEGQVQQTPTTSTSNTQSGQKVDTWAAGVVTVASKNGLLSKQDMAMDFTAYATRQEVAYWIARGLNLTPVYGKEVQKVYSFYDSENFNPDYIPYIEAMLKNGIMSGYSGEIFGPDDNITREQMAAVLNRAFNVGYSLMGYLKINATVEDIIAESIVGSSGIRRTYVLLNDSGQNEYIIVQNTNTGNKTVHNSDFLTVSNGSPAYSNAIHKGDNVTFYVGGQDVIYAEKNAVNESTLYGTIEDITDSYIKLVSESGSEYVFSYNANTQVNMNDYPASIKDLKYGQNATVYLNGNTAARIDAEYLDLGNGTIEVGSRQVSGKVIGIKTDSNNIDVTLDDGNTYSIAFDTPVLKEGVSISPMSIMEGNYVKLYFDSIETSSPVKVSVENDYHKVVDVIRGNLGSLFGQNSTLSINNSEYYYQGTWQKADTYSTYQLDGAQIYYNGVEISRDDLKSYKGNEVYIALEDHYGVKSASFISITGNFTMSYSGIASFDSVSKNIVLSDGRKVAVSDGTLILSNGMMVSPLSLTGSKQVYVSFSRTDGGLYANFVSIIDSVIDNYYYAEGYISSITSDSVSIGNHTYYAPYYQGYGYYEIDNNQLAFEGGSKTFYVGDKTYIVDNTGKTPTIIPYTDFLNQKYGNQQYYNIYVVSQGDNAIAINIMAEDLRARVSTAEVEFVNGSLITLKNVNDWNEFNSIWNLNPSFDTLDVSKAVIVKNGQAVDVNSIKPGDSLYIVRDGVMGIFVTVR